MMCKSYYLIDLVFLGVIVQVSIDGQQHASENFIGKEGLYRSRYPVTTATSSVHTKYHELRFPRPRSTPLARWETDAYTQRYDINDRTGCNSMYLYQYVAHVCSSMRALLRVPISNPTLPITTILPLRFFEFSLSVCPHPLRLLISFSHT